MDEKKESQHLIVKPLKAVIAVLYVEEDEKKESQHWSVKTYERTCWIFKSIVLCLS